MSGVQIPLARLKTSLNEKSFLFNIRVLIPDILRMSPRSLVSLGAFLMVNPKKLRCRTIFFNGFAIVGMSGFDPLTAHYETLRFEVSFFLTCPKIYIYLQCK